MPENIPMEGQVPMGQPMGANIAPPPVSPAEAPVNGLAVPEGEENVSPEEQARMRFEIESSLKDVQEKHDEVQKRKMLNDEKLEALKEEIVAKMFERMKGLGVDPTSLESINEFLQQLQYQDPDLYEMFEIAINAIDPVGTPLGNANQEMAPMQGGGGESMPQEGIPLQEEVPQEEVPQEEVPMPQEEGGLMEQNTTNLQENMLRQ